MSDRITRKKLEGLCEYLNTLTDSPQETWTRGEDGQLRANPGNFSISGAYGGFNLERICTDGGGVTCPLNCGHIPARELYNQMRAYIAGIRLMKEGY